MVDNIELNIKQGYCNEGCLIVVVSWFSNSTLYISIYVYKACLIVKSTLK